MRFLALLLVISCGDSAAPATPVATAPPAPAIPANTHAQRRVPRPAVLAPAADRAFYTTTFSRTPSAGELAALGTLVFRDRSLSHDRKLACASCHDPAHAFGPVVARPGLRVAPSLRYLQSVPRFTEHYLDPDLDDGADQGPAGGLTWDGRAQSLHDQARSPLYGADEMALASPHELAQRFANAPYAAQARAMFGADVFGSDATAEKALLLALEVYQQDAATFYPYTSKLDDIIRGHATFTPAEQRGKQLFDDPAKGNCARCHPDIGPAPAFTDYGFIALGVPAVRGAPLDLGLCGPRRHDLADRAEYCGKFRTPSLRNVATRKRFFHNGSLTSLHDVVAFYATRDADPKRWTTDLPAQYRGNLDMEAPFGGHSAVLSEAEIADVVAFLGTLTDR
ncbi:MAG TPA: cytochrome c peroxidase [Kofleriaceae bacterium]|nr:cytochrome c peroxidase [Kofleriaceae bacterium]